MSNPPFSPAQRQTASRFVAALAVAVANSARMPGDACGTAVSARSNALTRAGQAWGNAAVFPTKPAAARDTAA